MTISDDATRARGPWVLRFPTSFFVASSISFKKKRPVKENRPDPPHDDNGTGTLYRIPAREEAPFTFRARRAKRKRFGAAAGARPIRKTWTSAMPATKPPTCAP